MEFCKILKPDQIDKIACVVADGKWESLTSIRKRTKADIVINGPIFNMITYKIHSKFVCNYKQCGSGANSWGLRFDDGYPPQWSWGGTGAQNFISEFGLLVVDGKIRNSVSASPKAKRGRTAIGVTPSGEFVIYVVLDTAKRSEKKTAKELAEKIGVNVMTIVRIEKGVKPGFLTAAKILAEVKKEDAEILEQPNSDI